MYIQSYFFLIKGPGAFRLASRPLRSPVNSREKTNNLRILGRAPYIHDRLAKASRLNDNLTHALYAPIPRRTARPASGFGSRRPAREVGAGGARVEGPVAVPAGKIAVVHRQ